MVVFAAFPPPHYNASPGGAKPPFVRFGGVAPGLRAAPRVSLSLPYLAPPWVGYRKSSST